MDGGGVAVSWAATWTAASCWRAGCAGLEDVPLHVGRRWLGRGYPRPLLEDLFWNNLRRLI